MGCDIHLALERRLRKEKKHILSPEERDKNGNIIQEEISWIDHNTDWQWCDIINRFDDEMWSDRVYDMFAVLGNVRNYGDKHIALKGFPNDVTYETLKRYADKVITDAEYFKLSEEDDEWFTKGKVSESDAEGYVKQGYSVYIDYKDKFDKQRDGRYCSCPDWHSPNWCTTQEMEESIKKVFYNNEGNLIGDYIEWLALLGAMKGYESSGEYECRAVFWFDN